MKAIISVFLFCSLALITNAQTRLSGKVVDLTTGQAIDYATVAVADKMTDKIVDGAVADAAGSFVINSLPAGSYKVTISFLGYIPYTIDSLSLSGSQVVLPIIRLKSNQQALRSVTVTGSAPIVAYKIDKIVYNAANDVTAQGGVALDVLKKVPQVSVDVDGNVELQGSSNIRFLINGKPSGIFGNSLADALASIPASQIRSIEAITSPGAKYDAQGTGGIINIILKDNKMKGMNGSVNLSAGTRVENASVNLNMRSGNFGVNAFFSGNATLNATAPSSQDRTSYNPADQTTTRLWQQSDGRTKRSGYQAGIGFDWGLSKTDMITGSFQYNKFSNNKDGITQQQQQVRDLSGNTLSDIYSWRNATSSMSTYSLDWSVDYLHKFKREGEEIDVNYNSSFSRPTLQYSQDQSYLSSVNPYTGTSSYNPGTDNQTNISIDYVRPINKKTILEVGAKSMFQDISSLADVSILSPSNGAYHRDALQSYALNYTMNIYAGYVSGTFSLFNFLNVKAGFRVEHTDIRIDYANTHIPSYTTYVPSVIFSHKINEQQLIKLAYAHRIERPDYEELNPFLNLSDPYNITTGNPLLKPEIGDNIELGYSHSFKNGANLYIALSERINSRDIKPYTVFYPTYTAGDSVYDNVSVTSRVNIGMEYNSGLIITGSVPIARKLNVRGNLMLFNRRIINDLDPANRVTDGFNWRLNMNLGYELPGNLIAEAFGNYRSAFNNIQGRNPQFLTYTLAFRKQFLNKNASVGLTATNFLHNYVKQVTTISTGTYDSYVVREIPLRSFGITFTYKFGKLDFNKDKKRDSNVMDADSN